ncbi:MAG: dihydrofolate reductase [Balneolales bacterium]|nr:dihydrofolate reductase [Balneolales bacterium]
MPKFVIIAAHDPNLVIGENGSMPWHYPADLKHFKQTTLGKPLLMGRRTFEEIGGKPLPGRPCYVLSTKDLKAEGVVFFKSLDEALSYFHSTDYDLVYIAGGAVLYEQAFNFSNEMIISEIKSAYEGDTFFPEYRHKIGIIWNLIESEDKGDFIIKRYQKK